MPQRGAENNQSRPQVTPNMCHRFRPFWVHPLYTLGCRPSIAARKRSGERAPVPTHYLGYLHCTVPEVQSAIRSRPVSTAICLKA
eukprot:12089239-Alexandrium_andersonii.AAC.1